MWISQSYGQLLQSTTQICHFKTELLKFVTHYMSKTSELLLSEGKISKSADNFQINSQKHNPRKYLEVQVHKIKL